ncbi:ATP-binding protein [Thermodesulfobacteriota bacterium]
MKKGRIEREANPSKFPLNLAIVGGGRTCQLFLKLLDTELLNNSSLNIIGVCDIDPQAEGLLLAKKMGIYTTDNFFNLFEIDNLDGVLELTGRREVHKELIRYKPSRVGIIGYDIDQLLKNYFITDQRMKSAEQKLAAEKGASDFLIQQANERIVLLKPDFTIIEASLPYLKAVGKSKKEVIGAHCYEITHGLNVPCSSSLPELGCPLLETLRTRESAHVIHEHPSPDDQPTYCDMVTYPIKGPSGEVLQVIEIWKDITEELSSRWENRVQLLKSDFKKLIQEDRMISLGKLVASSVHEINNPIQGLLTFSHLMYQTLDEGEPSPQDLDDFKKHLALMSSELERCGNIISGLLSFSRQSEMEYTDADLNEVLDQVVSLTRHKGEIQDVILRIDLFSGPLIINGDVNQLQQCFLNLIFNAIEAMPQGGQLSVISNLDKKHKKALVEIHDEGYGIPEENMDHIFDPFFTTKVEGEGTGMGLSIVYGIVKNHKGQVKVESQVGKGSSFFMEFPLS